MHYRTHKKQKPISSIAQTKITRAGSAGSNMTNLSLCTARTQRFVHSNNRLSSVSYQKSLSILLISVVCNLSLILDYKLFLILGSTVQLGQINYFKYQISGSWFGETRRHFYSALLWSSLVQVSTEIDIQVCIQISICQQLSKLDQDSYKLWFLFLCSWTNFLTSEAP